MFIFDFGWSHPEADAHGAETSHVGSVQPAVEIPPVASFGRCPADFGQCTDARIALIFEKVSGMHHQFAPLGGFDAANPLAIFGRDEFFGTEIV